MGPDAAPAREINKRPLQGGVYTRVRCNFLFVAPSLCIKESELREGLAVIDKVLDYTDTMAE